MEKRIYMQPVIKVKMMEATALLAASEEQVSGEMSEGSAGGKDITIWQWLAD